MNRIEPTIDSASSVATPTRSVARQKYDAHLSALQVASTELYNTMVATESAAVLEAYKLLHNTIMNRTACGLNVLFDDLFNHSEIRARMVKHASARAIVAFDQIVSLNKENFKMLKALPEIDMDDYDRNSGWVGLLILCLMGWGLYKFFMWFAAL